MFKNTYFYLLLTISLFISCANSKTPKIDNTENTAIITGANNTSAYFSLLKGKKTAVVGNQTTVIFKKDGRYTHLVDSLLTSGIEIMKVFSPEHGFRGKADAGEHVADGVDVQTGLPIFSLHGKNRKPSKEHLEGIDIVVFDIQDVGVRFYTYISTMHNVMEACAENNIPVIVLDRPNPNGHYVDGPTLNSEFKSFVGMHEVPLVYGMTIGEYAKMINGEKWLKDGVICDLTVIELTNYTHQSTYSLPIRPSPNLPNDQSINLYPSLGMFEGTPINAGRGTEFQFQQYGAPYFPISQFSYTPTPNFGSKYPKHDGQVCYGVNLRNHERMSAVSMEWILDAYHKSPDKDAFFGATFTIHAGSEQLQKQMEEGLTAEEIRASWQPEIETFKKMRSKYLIYP